MIKAYLTSIEENPPPEYIKQVGLYSTVDKEGYRSITIIDVDEDKLSDALKFSYANMISYFYDIPGFNYQIDMCLEAKGAINMFKDSKLSK